jgi:hypothetical protein
VRERAAGNLRRPNYKHGQYKYLYNSLSAIYSSHGIYYRNTGIQFKPTQFNKVSFMVIFDLTPDGCTSDGHTSLRNNGTIRIELKFEEAIAEAVTIQL